MPTLTRPQRPATGLTSSPFKAFINSRAFAQARVQTDPIDKESEMEALQTMTNEQVEAKCQEFGLLSV